MFYETEKNNHGLPHDPFKAIVAPRPIGWIGSKGSDGSINLAPYSYFNAVSDKPKIVMFSSSGRKDSLRNVEETGVFTTSLVSRDLVDGMNMSSIDSPYGKNEFELAGLEMAQGQMVDACYVAKAWAALECKVTEIFQPKTLGGNESSNWVVFGQVVGIHIRDEALNDGLLDGQVTVPVARLGYMDYSDAADVFSMRRPTWVED